MLFRGAQEGLTNVRRHAGADRADVELDWTDPGEVALRVRDDGRGPGGPGRARSSCGPAGGARVPGSGLTGLGERARAHGGTVVLRAGDGGGAVLDVRVPG